MNDQLIQLCIDKQINALTSIKSLVKTAKYRHLYKFLVKHKGRIFISGVGKNSNIATKISESMASLGIKSGYISPTNYLHGDGGFIEDNDCVIYITRSGTTDEILAMIDHIKETRPTIVQFLLHCNEYTPPNIIPIWNMCIPNVKEGDENSLAPTTSTTAFLCLLDTLTIALSAQKGFTRQKFLATHPGGNLGKMLREEKNV
tara:strand:+ start:345 stop:950 length:606 start_codon:yes stop_codon:yes gene_type:complete